MSILNRPLFRRKLSKNELKMHGIQAFANGGVVAPYDYLMQRRMADGGPTDPKDLLPQVPPRENMADPVNIQTGESMLVNNFINLMKESGLIEELKEAQRTGNKQLESTLYEVYRNAYKKQVTEPMEEGMASENMMGYANGGDVEKSTNPFGIDLGYNESGAISGDKLLGGATLGLGGGESSLPSGSIEKIKEFFSSDDSTSSTSSTKGPFGRNKETTREVSVNTSKNQSGKYAGKKAGDIIEESEIQEDEDGVQFKIVRRLIQGSKGELRLGAEEKIITFTPDKVITTGRGGKTVKGSGEKANVTSNTETTTNDSQNFAPIADQDSEVEELTEVSRIQQLIKERSDLYKDILGDPTKQMASQGFLQLAQFGLNLAAAQGGNFATKVARSAKDPLTAFAKIAQDAQNDSKGIELAAIKSAEDILKTEIAADGRKLSDDDKIQTIFSATFETTQNPTTAARAAGGIKKSLLAGNVADLFENPTLAGKKEGTINTKKLIQAKGNQNVYYIDVDGVRVPAVLKESSQTKKTVTIEDFVALQDVKLI